MMIELLKNGSGIHIKKENRGKFTSYCGGKVTSECIARGKNSPNPKIRKRATFAANARKFKHQWGGTLEDTRSDTTRQGYHEGQTPWGAAYQDNISPLTALEILNDINNYGKTNPYSLRYDATYIPPLTGIAPTPGFLKRPITIPQGMSGEELAALIRASKANPAFNDAEKIAQLDFQSQFGKGMPLATRRGRLAKKDAFGNNVRYSDDIVQPVQKSNTVYLKEGMSGRQYAAIKNRKAGIKTDSKQSRQAAYRDQKQQIKEDLEIRQASRTAQEEAKHQSDWATGKIGLKRGRKPVKRYKDATQDLQKNRPDSWEANQAGIFLRNYTNAKDPTAKSRWLAKWSQFIDDLKNKGILGME